MAEQTPIEKEMSERNLRDRKTLAADLEAAFIQCGASSPSLTRLLFDVADVIQTNHGWVKRGATDKPIPAEWYTEYTRTKVALSIAERSLEKLGGLIKQARDILR